MTRLRSAFLSFEYQHDLWRASVVRNQRVVDLRSAAGWKDDTIWREAKLQGDEAVRALIDGALDGTELTVVLIGRRSAEREWLDYGIDQTLRRGNPVLGMRIHNIRDQRGAQEWFRGFTPRSLRDHRSVVANYEPSTFAAYVERAIVSAGRPCLPHGKNQCFWCHRMGWWFLA